MINLTNEENKEIMDDKTTSSETSPLENNEVKKNEESLESENVTTNDVTSEAKKSSKSKDSSSSRGSSIPKEMRPENWNPFAAPERKPNPKFAKKPVFENPFETRLLDVKRVIKVTKGGRRFKFSALVVVGDKKGRVGYAIGKSIEVPEAIKKAERLARKNLWKINVVGKQNTVSHDIIGHHGAADVLLKPAAEGRGIIASDNVRAVVELAGIRNIYSKNLGSNNPLNVVRATINGLINIRTKEDIIKLRGKKEL